MEPNEKNTEENLDENQNHPQEHEKHINDLKNQVIEGEEILGGVNAYFTGDPNEEFLATRAGGGGGDSRGGSGG